MEKELIVGSVSVGYTLMTSLPNLERRLAAIILSHNGNTRYIFTTRAPILELKTNETPTMTPTTTWSNTTEQ